MITNKSLPALTAGGRLIDTSPQAFSFLRDSSDLLDDPREMHHRMDEDGYLFLPSFLDREEVHAARLDICKALAQDGLLDLSYPLDMAIASSDSNVYFRPDIVASGPPRESVERVIYGDRVMDVFSKLLGGRAIHYNYTWLRTVGPGHGTVPHCDVVFMGRGTHNLYTAWVPLGDIPLSVGGLILIEGSHKDQEVRDGYCTYDVDSVCTNKSAISVMADAGFHGFGALASHIAPIRDRMGRRLLTAEEYRMGDMLIFSVFTVHGSLDNNSKEIRLSSDSRYQLEGEPIDERWIGDNPPGHGGNSVKGMIC